MKSPLFAMALTALLLACAQSGEQPGDQSDEQAGEQAGEQSELERADEQVLFHSRGYGRRKVYAGLPAISPLPVREAAVALLRETLIREPAGPSPPPP